MLTSSIFYSPATPQQKVPFHPAVHFHNLAHIGSGPARGLQAGEVLPGAFKENTGNRKYLAINYTKYKPAVQCPRGLQRQNSQHLVMELPQDSQKAVPPHAAASY